MSLYFLGYHITGEAARWHRSIAIDIAERFGTAKIYEKAPPHITMYRPFITNDIATICQTVATFAATAPADMRVSMDGFAHFDQAVVYADIDVPVPVQAWVEALQHTLETTHHLPPHPFPHWQPHATLAARLSPKKFEQAWNHVLSLNTPRFDLSLDTVTLFRFKENRGWQPITLPTNSL